VSEFKINNAEMKQLRRISGKTKWNGIKNRASQKDNSTTEE